MSEMHYRVEILMFGQWGRVWEGFTRIADAKRAGSSLGIGDDGATSGYMPKWRIVSYDVEERIQELSQYPEESCPDCYKEPVARHRRMVMQRAGE